MVQQEYLFKIILIDYTYDIVLGINNIYIDRFYYRAI